MLSGAVIGLLGGFVGLILGTLRMPALLRLVGEVPGRAVGTNLLVGVLVGRRRPDRPPAERRARPRHRSCVGVRRASIPGALLGAA